MSSSCEEQRYDVWNTHVYNHNKFLSPNTASYTICNTMYSVGDGCKLD